MAERSPGLVKDFLRTFIGSIGLMFIPMPISIFKRQLAGFTREDGDMEFYSHPNFVCTMHLIWVGWLVTLGALYNDFASQPGREWHEIPPGWLGWPWLFVLTLTIIVMGLRFARVAVGFLVACITIVLLGLGLTQALSDVELFKQISEVLGRVKVNVDSGVPMVVSLVLGLVFVSVAAWRRMNDRWILKPTGNYLEHENFQEKDRTIAKGAKTFVAVFPCLVRRYLMFGFGDIEVRSSTGTTLIDRIEGCFFASRHADVIKFRFSTTDIMMAQDEEVEEEEAAAEDLM